MNQWPEYGEHLRTGEYSIDIRDDTTLSVSSSSLSSSSTAAVTSSGTNDITSGHVVSLVRNGVGVDIYRKPVLGLKKCFHCPNCRYSTDRKNNLKRHLGTMHRDQYVAGVMELDQSNYRISVQRRASSFQSYSRSLNKKHVATLLLDNFTRSDDDSRKLTNDVNTRSQGGTLPLHPLIITENDDVNTLAHAYNQPQQSSSSSRSATQTNDVNTNHSVAGTQPQPPSPPTTRNYDVKTSQTAQNGDVSTYRCEDGTQSFLPSSTTDCRNSLPEFEPRPATAYRRHSSRMFFYDRLRCTHDYSNAADHSG